ncbi:MAG TPA: TonB-dependent receptor [Burkholderiales bacterium]|jgi:outer membrane receptor protein involved in Fe transport
MKSISMASGAAFALGCLAGPVAAQTAPTQPAPAKPATAQAAPTQPAPTQPAPVQAPAGAGSVAGKLSDALGRPLAGATVQLRGADGKIAARGQSDAQGAFAFRGVAPGVYAVVADHAGFDTGTSIVTVARGPAPAVALTLASQQALELNVAVNRPQRAAPPRNAISAATGGSSYGFDHKDIESMPAGEDTQVNQVLLQAPGVTNDSYGQLHVRGDHGNLQYRINGVVLPEGISGFGQSLDTRFADRIDLLTGALPSQYGYRTAGVVDIQTKNGFTNGGSVSYTFGSHNTSNPSFEVEGTKGDWSYYVTGSYLRNNLGIESPTSAANPLHDRTEQTKGFGYFSYLISPTTKLNVIAGTSYGKFQIPNNPDQAPNPDFLTAAGATGFSSSALNENQTEINNYGIVALQGSLNDKFDYQIAGFMRKSSVEYFPDPLGDLVFNGLSAHIYRSSVTTGVQADGTYRLNAAHTLRMGLTASTEDDRSQNSATVFPVDATGTVSGGPMTIVDNNGKNGNKLYGVYLQDEWKITDKLTFNYGARADRMDAYTSAGQISPRAGFVYKLLPATTLHAGYARYFTPPPNELVSQGTLNLFTGTTNAPANLQNSQVQPERSHYFDAGITHELIPGLTLGLDGYYKKVRNLLDEGQFGTALIFTPFNYSRATVYGAELSATWKKDNLSAYLNYATSKARATDIDSAQFNFDPTELAYIASNNVYVDHDQRVTISGGASYRWHDTEFSVNGFYGSGLRAGFANTDKLPGYTQVNLGVVQHLNTADLGKVDLRFSVVNVFNQAYELRDGTGIGVGAPQWGPRRGFFGTISKVF